MRQQSEAWRTSYFAFADDTIAPRTASSCSVVSFALKPSMDASMAYIIIVHGHGCMHVR